jgi:hypothetical protein
MNTKEILRYLGYGRHEAKEQVLVLIEACVRELERAAVPKSIYKEYPLSFYGEEGIDCCAFQTCSKALKKNLKDCQSVLLFGATLGTGVDLLLHRYNRLEMSKAVVLQAAAAAMLEDYCDQMNEELEKKYEEKGLYLRPRFSPGYGDFSLECQPALLGGLEAGKRIGITLTDSLLMAPSKSVTAVIGISRIPGTCGMRSCQDCEKRDCAYRRT